MNHFSFNEISCADYGITWRTRNRPILPTIRQQYETIPGKHGTYDFSDGTLEDRIIEIDCTIVEASLGDLRYNSRQIAAWLFNAGKARLVFDDEPDVYYFGRIANQIDLEQTASLGEFTLQFRCEPFAYHYKDAAAPTLNDETLLYRDIRLNDEYSFTVTGATTVEVNNFGTASVKPIIQVTGSFTMFNLTVNGKTLNYTEALSSGTLEIDCERMTAKVGTTNKLPKVIGSFIELPLGVNNVLIGGTGLNCTVSFIFKPRFL